MTDDTPFPDPDWTPEIDPKAGRFMRRWFDSLSTDEWCSLLRFYRVLRIAFWDRDRCAMQWYGKSREDARAFLLPVVQELDWYAYLGSK